MYMPYAFQIVPDSTKVFMLFEYASHDRTTTRAPPRTRKASDGGEAIRARHWEGDTSSRTSPISTITWFDR